MGIHDNNCRWKTFQRKTLDTIRRMSSATTYFGCEGARRGFVEVNGLRLSFLEWEAPGRPVVCFLHGGSAHAHWFDHVMPALVRARAPRARRPVPHHRARSARPR